jgi:ppGpp synthetase/RelA/SpoT-type nucleotidyltranferase
MGIDMEQNTQDVIERILGEYKGSHSLYVAFTDCVKALVDQLLQSVESKVDHTTKRVKDEESLRKKLITKLAEDETKYKILSDVTDIAGVLETFGFTRAWRMRRHGFGKTDL